MHPSSASPPAVNCPVGDQLAIVERMSLASGTSGGTAQFNRVSALRTKLKYFAPSLTSTSRLSVASSSFPGCH